MPVQNPIMNILRGDRSTEAFSAASRTGAMAQRSFQNGASMALKMDQLLQQEEDRLYNRSAQSQKMLQDTLTNSMNMQFKKDEAIRAQQNSDRTFKENKRQFGINEGLAETRLNDSLLTNKLSRDVNEAKLTELERVAKVKDGAIKRIRDIGGNFMPDRKDYNTTFDAAADLEKFGLIQSTKNMKNFKSQFDQKAYNRDSYLALGKMNALYETAGLGTPYKDQLTLMGKEIDNAADLRKEIVKNTMKENSAISKHARELPGAITDDAIDFTKSINPKTGLNYTLSEATAMATIMNTGKPGAVPANLPGSNETVENVQARALSNNSKNAEGVWSAVLNNFKNDPNTMYTEGGMNNIQSALTSSGTKIANEAYSFINDPSIPEDVRSAAILGATNKVAQTISYDPMSKDNKIKINSLAQGPIAEIAKTKVDVVNETLDPNYSSSFIQLMKENSYAGNVARGWFSAVGMGEDGTKSQASIATAMKELDSRSMSESKPPVFSTLVRGYKEIQEGIFGENKSLGFGKGMVNNTQSNYYNLSSEKTKDGTMLGNFLVKGSMFKTYGSKANKASYDSAVRKMSASDIEDANNNKYSLARSLQLYMNDPVRMYNKNDGNGPGFVHHSTDMVTVRLNNINTGEAQDVEIPVNKAFQMLGLLTSGTTLK